MIKVNSEIGKLKKVLLHRPGVETEMLTPDTFEELLFDDSYYLKVARKEHDAFAKVFKDNGVEVVYVEQLIADTLDEGGPALKEQFLRQFILEGGVYDDHVASRLVEYFKTFTNTKEAIDKMIAGIK
jgi:arginine deiminase